MLNSVSIDPISLNWDSIIRTKNTYTAYSQTPICTFVWKVSSIDVLPLPYNRDFWYVQMILSSSANGTSVRIASSYEPGTIFPKIWDTLFSINIDNTNEDGTYTDAVILLETLPQKEYDKYYSNPRTRIQEFPTCITTHMPDIPIIRKHAPDFLFLIIAGIVLCILLSVLIRNEYKKIRTHS